MDSRETCLKRVDALVTGPLVLSTLVGACASTSENNSDTTAAALALSPYQIPGLVMGLVHNQNQTDANTVMTSGLQSDAMHLEGGDLGASVHRGYEWWALPDTGGDPNALLLPPGVVVALKHNANQRAMSITAFGIDPVSGGSLPGFQRQSGGDRGAAAGVGYYWYESTGVGFTNWQSIDELLPKHTVIGLKHSMNQRGKVLLWNGVAYDPVRDAPAPPGFRRVFGGDLGAPSGHGFYWYEKTTGTEVITRPSLTVTLERGISLTSSDSAMLDRDGDCLIDSLEDQLAAQLRPYLVFDDAESARGDLEPVTLYRVYPISATEVRIRWVFLFEQDGGYGPAKEFTCFSDAHGGDNDMADYDLTSYDGLTWQITRVSLSDNGIVHWPGSSRLEVFDNVHPTIYLSASKHHEYLTRDNDGGDSPYSAFACNDDVNGAGTRLLVDAISPGLSSNNVGEPDIHPPSRFANWLPMFQVTPGEAYPVWSSADFYSVAAIQSKFPAVDYPGQPNGCLHSPCRQGPPLDPNCFLEAADICGFDPYCCTTYWDDICISETPSGCL